jgi:hypothetical protein
MCCHDFMEKVLSQNVKKPAEVGQEHLDLNRFILNTQFGVVMRTNVSLIYCFREQYADKIQHKPLLGFCTMGSC